MSPGACEIVCVSAAGSAGCSMQIMMLQLRAANMGWISSFFISVFGFLLAMPYGGEVCGCKINSEERITSPNSPFRINRKGNNFDFSQ